MAQGKLFVPTAEERKQVEAMAGYGVPHDNIAAIIRDGIDSDTLKKHFKKELMQGKAKANAKVGQTLFQKATHSWKQYSDRPVNYDNVYFYCPRVFAKDGFNVSLQIQNGNYCSSENGYRKFGHTWEEVEFGFPRAR